MSHQTEWGKEFEDKFVKYTPKGNYPMVSANGHAKVESLKSFITTLIAKEKEKSEHEGFTNGYIKGRAEERTRVVEILKSMNRKEKHESNCHPYTLDKREYECSCGNDVFVKGWNKFRAEALLAITEQK